MPYGALRNVYPNVALPLENRSTMNAPPIPGPARSGLSRRHWLVLAGLGIAAHTTHAAGAALQPATAMPAHLTAALRQGNPLIVMVSLPGCPFCHVARQNYLAPMQREQNLTIVQVDMNSPMAMNDLDGMVTTHDRQVKAWGIRVAPTVLFFGRGGSEAASRLVGASLPDFYGAYLDERVASARKTLG